MILKKSDIPALLGALSAEQTVFVPGQDGTNTRFVAYNEGVQTRFDLQNTKMPPKDILFPMTEKMYRWKREDGALDISTSFEEASPFTIFGIRPCDMASIDRLDEVFLTKGFVDDFYATKRQNATIVAIACAQVARECFCDSMDVDPNEAPRADILLSEVGEGYAVSAQTEKGAQALQAWGPYLSEGDATPQRVECTLKLNMEGVSEKLHGMFDDELWQDVADQCLTCGTCTFICPTCYCFDISQDVRADEGNRFRCWDSCMFTDYTAMAGGHNPRASKSARVRQRFMHKLCYFNDRYGMNLCVGCGRCMVDCPAAVDISVIIDRIAAAQPQMEGERNE